MWPGVQVVADGRRPGPRQADAERADARAGRAARGDGDRRQPHGPRRRLQHRPPTGTTGTREKQFLGYLVNIVHISTNKRWATI